MRLKLHEEIKLGVSQSRNAIYIPIIVISKKCHFIIFAIPNFVQNTKKKHLNSIYIAWIMFVRQMNGVSLPVSIAKLGFLLK